MKKQLDQTKRRELIEKIAESPQKKYKPTRKELEEAYGYLDYCYNCGLKIYPGEWFSHSLVGNCHKFGCSFTARMFGAALNTIKLIILIPLMIIGLIIYPFIILKRIILRERCGGW